MKHVASGSTGRRSAPSAGGCRHGAAPRTPEIPELRQTETATAAERPERTKERRRELPSEKKNGNRARDPRQRRALRRSLPFFCLLLGLTAFAWALPLRPTVAEEEKRNLEAPPSLEEQNVLNGEYFKQTDKWFSDTFTGRSFWVKLSNKWKTLYGKNDVVIYGDFGQSDEVPISDPVPKAEESAAPAAAPAVVPTAEPDPAAIQAPWETEGENPAVPTAEPEPEETIPPAQTEWGGERVDETKTMNITRTLIQLDDAGYEWPGFSRTDGENYAALMNKAGDLVGDKCRVFSILAPFSSSVMLEPEFITGRLESSLETDVLTYLEGLMNGNNVIPVRVIDTLIGHNAEYVYFRTDHHWTALGAYYAYVEWAKAAGVTPVPLSRYTVLDQGDYLGTYYEAAEQSDLMAAHPDDCIAYVPPGDITLYYTDASDDTLDYYGGEYSLIYDEREAPVWNKYAGFLWGDHDFSVLVNDSIPDDSSVLVYKNSMGNPFVYYLTQHYHTVYIADYRYYETRSLREAVEYYDVDDVIFMNNTSQAEWVGGVASMAKAIGD